MDLLAQHQAWRSRTNEGKQADLVGAGTQTAGLSFGGRIEASEHYGWEEMVLCGSPVRIKGRQIYYHRSRGQYAIEQDHTVLVALKEEEKLALKAIQDFAEDVEWAKRCEAERRRGAEEANPSLRGGSTMPERTSIIRRSDEQTSRNSDGD